MQPSVDPSVDNDTNASPSPNPDMRRGRTRDRSQRRSTAAKSARTDDEHESSTLRGRSRQRAPSPSNSSSRNPSSSVLSPTRHLLVYKRLRESRREHCPSRAPSPPGALRRARRTRSRGRGPRLEPEVRETTEARSGLRNELHMNEEEPSRGTTES